ncbi:hypothetical protein BYT27DRAFT_7188839 [Phlegmacium glaucopus]|nr:hypothetical protein BYT27DRAFT_7188839 [Phlegmacium glaucopus]
MRNMRLRRPIKPKTGPGRALSSRGASAGAGLLGLIADVCPADTVAVTWIVFPAAVVTTTGGEEFVDVEDEE